MPLRGGLEPSRALCSSQRKELRERMPQADGLVRHDAKHNPSSSSEESCFCTPLDHILHEAGVYLGGGSGLSSKFHSEEMSRQKEKDLLGKVSH